MRNVRMIIWAVIVLFDAGYVNAAYTWTTLDRPGSPVTYILGIDGTNLVGMCSGDYGYDGFLYNGATWNTLNMPGAYDTRIFDIEGSNIVGFCDFASYGFLHDGSVWTRLPFAAEGISGNNIVGRNVLYNRITGAITTLNMPGASETSIHGIDGGNLVGEYTDSFGNYRGFLYDGANWIPLDKPGARYTRVYGIDGTNLVGYYNDASGSHGFLYNRITSTWITLDKPGANSTFITDISGNRITGYYTVGIAHGFVCTIPEPTTLLLLGLGGLLLRKRKN